MTINDGFKFDFLPLNMPLLFAHNNELRGAAAFCLALLNDRLSEHSLILKVGYVKAWRIITCQVNYFITIPHCGFSFSNYSSKNCSGEKL